MKIFIDNKLIQKLTAPEVQGDGQPLVESFIGMCVLPNNKSLQVNFGWPSLFEYLHLGSLFEKFPKFDDQSNLFAFITSALDLGAETDLLIRLYDQVFVEYLTQVKALPQIHPKFLLEQIQKKRASSSSLVNELFSHPLDKYEKSLMENPANTIHDLILHLAWDRVCTNLAILFELPSSNPTFQKGLEIFKECLLESFQHITGHGKTVPGFFRLLEALYAYQMREERLETYTDAEWLILCQSSRALKPREGLIDLFYIDAALVEEEKFKQNHEQDLLKVFTLDSTEKVNAALALADYMIEKLKLEVPDWRYVLRPVEIVCLGDHRSYLSIDTVIRH